MALTGKQKAAMLLMSLDATTATELLKGVDPETIQELAVEVAYLEASGFKGTDAGTEVARQFYYALEGSGDFDVKGFLSSMLKTSVGEEKAERMQSQIREMLQKRDPFMSIRQADPNILATILSREHPQAAAVVLSELSPKKSSEVLSYLEESVQLKVVTRMTAAEPVSPEAKIRIAQIVSGHLETAVTVGSASTPDQAPRKVAVMLRNLNTEIRDGLLSSISQIDAEIGNMVNELMLVWDDITSIENRSLQNALREVDLSKLALALVEADEAIDEKIKSNISERAAETIEEETSLLSSPRLEEVKRARDKIVEVLRKMNEKGELNFIEE